MDFIERMAELSAKILREKDHILTEEAAKTAWVMPFINALGYNVFDPLEVVPEFTADVGVKKGEKVDYCILKDGKPTILIECKGASDELSIEHASQLYRYFTVARVRFAMLTNGILYRFYTDLEEPNRMDSKPFFEFNMLEIKDVAVDELKKFSKSSFDLDQILATASELKYTREIKRILSEQMANPTDDFVRLIAGEVYSGTKTVAVIKQFTEVTRRAFQQWLSERVSDRLKSALDTTLPVAEPTVEIAGNGKASGPSEDETQAYYVVKAIVCEVVDISRVVMRDQVSYCAILLDDNNRKPICRFHFHSPKKQISLFDAKKNETRVALADLDSMYAHTDALKAVVQAYDSGK